MEYEELDSMSSVCVQYREPRTENRLTKQSDIAAALCRRSPKRLAKRFRFVLLPNGGEGGRKGRIRGTEPSFI